MVGETQRLLWALAALTASACAKNTPQVQPPTEPTKPAVIAAENKAPSAAKPPPTESAPKGTKVLWANVVTTKDCFFFSGPFEHGRDATIGSIARLEHKGDKAVLHLGEVVFEGHGFQGRYEFTREDEREFEGKWTSTERIEAELSDEGLHGSYAYEECDVDGDQGCPGDCTIAAEFFARGLTSESADPQPTKGTGQAP
jgi:hypothetical protein